MLHPEMTRALADQHIRDLHRLAASSVRLDAPASPVAQHWAVLAMRLHLRRAAAATTRRRRRRPAPRPGRARRAATPTPQAGSAAGAAADGLHRVTAGHPTRPSRCASTPSSWTAPTRPPWPASTPRCWAGRSTRAATPPGRASPGTGRGWSLAFQRAERYVAPVLARRRAAAAAPRPDREGHGGRARPRRRAGRRPLDPQRAPTGRREPGLPGLRRPGRPPVLSLSLTAPGPWPGHRRRKGSGGVVQPGRHQLADSARTSAGPASPGRLP